VDARVTNVKDDSRPKMGWPAAATLITVVVGAAASTVAWAMAPGEQVSRAAPVEYVSSREIGEIKARLSAIEESNSQLRSELRSDIKDLRELVRQLLKQS
jgi:hypothetical protein